MFLATTALFVAAILAAATVTDRRRKRAAGLNPQVPTHGTAADEVATTAGTMAGTLASRGNAI